MGGIFAPLFVGGTVAVNERTRARRSSENTFETKKAAVESEKLAVKNKLAQDKKNKGLLAASRQRNLEGLSNEFSSLPGQQGAGTVSVLGGDGKNKSKLLNPLG